MKKAAEIIEQFVGANHLEGNIIPKEYFWGLFGLNQPAPTTPYAQAEKLNFQFMSAMDALKKGLLRDHKQDLSNNLRKGYNLITYQTRVGVAIREGTKEVSKALLRQRARLVHIPHPEQLPYTQRLERDLALHNIEMMRRLNSACRKRPE